VSKPTFDVYPFGPVSVRGKNSEFAVVSTGEPSGSGGVPLVNGVDGREDFSAGLNGRGCVVRDELPKEGGLLELDDIVLMLTAFKSCRSMVQR
jgi:hypothetical protein